MPRIPWFLTSQLLEENEQANDISNDPFVKKWSNQKLKNDANSKTNICIIYLTVLQQTIRQSNNYDPKNQGKFLLGLSNAQLLRGPAESAQGLRW